jgi:hypothetical protein
MTSCEQLLPLADGYEVPAAEDDDPPACHTTRYSPEVCRFATYRDLYQPD